MVVLRLFSLDTLLRVLLGITFFLVPLFITSLDPFWFVFDRWLLFYGFTIFIFIVWIIRGLRDGDLELQWSFFNILIFVFLLCVFLSTYTSIDMRRSMLGYFSDPAGGLLSFIALVIFYTVFCTVVKHAQDVRFYYRTLCVSLSILVVLQLLHYAAFSLWSVNVPAFVSQEVFSFIAFSVAFLLLGAYFHSERKVTRHSVLILFSLASLGVFIASIPPMLLFYLGGLAVFFYVFQRYPDDIAKRQLVWVVVPFFVLGFLILITGWNIDFLRGDGNHLSYSSSRAIISQGLMERRWLGFGPSTFSYSSGRFRVPQMNVEPTWDKVLGHSYNMWFDMLNDVGALGFLIFLASVFFFFVMLFRGVRYAFQEGSFLEYVGLLWVMVGWLSFSLFFSMSGVVVFVSFFCALLIYSLLIQMRGGVRYIRVPFVFSLRYKQFSFFLALCVCIVILFIGVLWVREITGVWYARRSLNVSPEIAVMRLDRAMSLVPWRVEYVGALSRVYLSFAHQEALASTPDTKHIREAVSLVIESSRRVLAMVPQDGLAQMTLGGIYEDLGLFVEGPHMLAELQYKQALLFEPNNPLFLIKLADLYRTKAFRSSDVISHQTNVEHARETYEKIFRLKPDYAKAYMGLALLEEREENIDSAIQAGELAFRYAPGDTEVMLQLARMYYNAERVYKKGRLFYAAEELLKRVIVKEPGSFNAHFLMGSLYKQMDEKKKSRVYFERAFGLGNSEEQKLVQKEL